jgi:hypothetical protein
MIRIGEQPKWGIETQDSGSSDAIPLFAKKTDGHATNDFTTMSARNARVDFGAANVADATNVEVFGMDRVTGRRLCYIRRPQYSTHVRGDDERDFPS